MRQLGWIIGLWLMGAASVFAQTAERGIIVTGEGRIFVAPDMARISLGVTHRAENAKDAARMTANAVAGILSGMEERGLRREDLQTSRYYLRPIWQNSGEQANGPRQIVGYEAGNSVTVTVRDLRFLGDVIDAAVDLGGNDFNGLQFDLKDDSAAQAAARKAAVENAMAKGAQLSEAAGVRIGKLLRLTENSFGGGPNMAQFDGARGAGDAIAMGEIEVTAQVTMVFSIRPNIRQ